MKKTINGLAIVAMIGVGCFGLTGCGNTEPKVEEVNNNTQTTSNQVINESEKKVVDETNKENESEDNTLNENISEEEKVKKVFSDYLVTAVNETVKELGSDYDATTKVEKVSILTEDERKAIKEINPDLKDTDICANITYSVKPKNLDNKDAFLVGSGEEAGDLIRHNVCVYLEKTDKSYVVKSAGTSF